MPETFEIQIVELGEPNTYKVRRNNDEYPLNYTIYSIGEAQGDSVPLGPTADMIIPQPIESLVIPGSWQTFGWKTPCRYYRYTHDIDWEEKIYQAIQRKQPQYIM